MARTRDELTFCGIDCDGCSIYRSTMYGEGLSAETVQRWQEDFRKYWKIDSVTAEQLNCKGCRYEGVDVFFGFRLCPIRDCCKTRGLSSCGLCAEFKTCKRHDIQEGRENLERIAAWNDEERSSHPQPTSRNIPNLWLTHDNSPHSTPAFQAPACAPLSTDLVFR